MSYKTFATFAAIGVVSVAVTAAQRPSAERPAVRDHAREVACGPQALLVPPEQPVRVTGGRERHRQLFAPGETVVLGGGTEQGLEAGKEYVVRRAVKDPFIEVLPQFTPVSVRTVGWVRVSHAQAQSATAEVLYVCDGMMPGDYVDLVETPAQAEPVAAAAGEPDYLNPARVIMGDERRQMGGPGALMVFDRGAEHDLRPGQRLTIFRMPSGPGGPVTAIAEATVVSVRTETSLLRIDQARDAVFVGDYVAVHK